MFVDFPEISISRLFYTLVCHDSIHLCGQKKAPQDHPRGHKAFAAYFSFALPSTEGFM